MTPLNISHFFSSGAEKSNYSLLRTEVGFLHFLHSYQDNPSTQKFICQFIKDEQHSDLKLPGNNRIYLIRFPYRISYNNILCNIFILFVYYSIHYYYL